MPKAQTQGFLITLGRAAGGSILFTVPMLMTMEMWSLGFMMDPGRLALMLILLIPMLSALAFVSGFKDRVSARGASVDAFVAFAVGSITCTLILAIFGIIRPGMAASEIIGKVILQTIPASMGAVLASSLMRGHDGDAEDDHENKQSYWGELFLMLAGSLLFAFNLAPTEEILVIAHEMEPWQTIILLLVSLGIMHAFVYRLGFSGQEGHPDSHSWWAVFSRFTVVGYVIAMFVSLYCMWSFGRTDGDNLEMIVAKTVVMGFPASIGAAAARLLI